MLKLKINLQDFRNDPRDDKKAKLTKKRSTTKSNIIEEEIEPTTINVEHKTKPSNVDKTKININLTPRTKTEISDFINKKNLNKTLNTISRKPEKNIVPNLIEKQKTQIKPDLIPVDLFLKKPVKELKAEVEKENEKIEKQPKIGHENKNEKSNNEPTIQKLSETEPNTAKIDRKKPSNKKSQNSKDLIIEDEEIKDDLDKSLGDQCVDKILNLFSTEKQSSAESKEPITEKPAPININNEERMAAPQNEINEEKLETNNDSNATIDNKTPQEIFTVNYTTKSNDTLKEQIDTQSTKIEIMINHLPANANSKLNMYIFLNVFIEKSIMGV
ncbi:uncharacterized protein LOC119835948 [Zerene cesonia]|uniref:uncharacterized protein LOC119835948 n=1 Tax=Zerene cesonia TaxID=33412 RepID=UPI0018E57CC1|nr:uncharacterized protein LOC119835948 [Zerene cesonia]